MYWGGKTDYLEIFVISVTFFYILDNVEKLPSYSIKKELAEMADSNLTWESIGRYKVQIGSGVFAVIGGVLGVIPPMVIGGVVIVGAVFYIGKKAFDAYHESKFKKWLQSQLESDSVSAELKQEYARMLAKYTN